MPRTQDKIRDIKPDKTPIKIHLRLNSSSSLMSNLMALTRSLKLISLTALLHLALGNLLWPLQFQTHLKRESHFVILNQETILILRRYNLIARRSKKNNWNNSWWKRIKLEDIRLCEQPVALSWSEIILREDITFCLKFTN
jgi:hypothetical protein